MKKFAILLLSMSFLFCNVAQPLFKPHLPPQIAEWYMQIPASQRVAMFKALNYVTGAVLISSIFMLHKEAHKKEKNKKVIVINGSIATAATILCVITNYLDTKNQVEHLSNVSVDFYNDLTDKVPSPIKKVGSWSYEWAKWGYKKVF